MEDKSKVKQGKSETAFSYRYTAMSSEEKTIVKRIRSQYIKSEDDRVEQLQRLDLKVKSLGTAISIVLGVLGTVIVGFGLTMVLEWYMVIGGAIVGVIGIAVLGITYPVYKAIMKKQKEKYALDIIRLSDELLYEEK